MAKKSMVEKNKLKRNTVQHRNRCQFCGRPRGYIRFFNVCRLCLRDLAGSGRIPGLTKSSW